MRRRRDDIRVRHGAGMHARGHKSGDVRHVHKKEGTNGLRGFADALKINDPRIGACAGDDHLWFVFVRELFDFVVVDALIFLFHAISDKFVHSAGEIQRMPMRQVAAMRKIHA